MSTNKHLPANAIFDEDGVVANQPYQLSGDGFGLSKLEIFTMAAMQGLLASAYYRGSPQSALKEVASEAVNFAEATLDELEKVE